MTDRAAAGAALLAFAAVALAGVLLRPALPVDETRYLSVAWEMWLSGDWLVPTKNFEIYTHKPPLLFWAIDAVWMVAGVSGTAARLVGPSFALLTIVLAARLARRLWPDDAGAGPRTVLALTATMAFGLYGGLTMFDTALAAATVAAILALVQAVETGRRRDWALLGTAIGAGALAKGPVILIHVLPAMLAVPFWSANQGRRSLRHLALGGGTALAVALAVVAMWLVPAILAGGPEYRDAILWTQSAGRMADSFAHARPWWFYLALLPALLFPVAWIPGFWSAARGIDRSEPGLRLCGVWILSALALFSLISGKQAHYLLPELAAAAIVVARLGRDLRGTLAVAIMPVLVMAALAVAASAGWLSLGDAGDLLHPRSVLMAWALFGLAICWLAVRLGGLRGGVVLSLGLLLSVDLAIGLTDLRSVFDTTRIASAIASREARGIAYYGQTYQAEFNFEGRLTRPVANPMTEAALLAWRTDHPDGLVVARTDRPMPGWRPRRTIRFRNLPYAIWHVADALTPASQATRRPTPTRTTTSWH